jgi:hypothetical protein
MMLKLKKKHGVTWNSTKIDWIGADPLRLIAFLGNTSNYLVNLVLMDNSGDVIA